MTSSLWHSKSTVMLMRQKRRPQKASFICFAMRDNYLVFVTFFNPLGFAGSKPLASAL
jgi:hypothetical protein